MNNEKMQNEMIDAGLMPSWNDHKDIISNSFNPRRKHNSWFSFVKTDKVRMIQVKTWMNKTVRWPVFDICFATQLQSPGPVTGVADTVSVCPAGQRQDKADPIFNVG